MIVVLIYNPPISEIQLAVTKKICYEFRNTWKGICVLLKTSYVFKIYLCGRHFICAVSRRCVGYAVEPLIQALCYRPEGRWFNFRWDF
jgi:hypothetical protein